MKKKLVSGLVALAAATTLSIAGAGDAQAQSGGIWRLEGRTPISSGYMYTYRNGPGHYFVTANYMGTWFASYHQP